MAKRRQDPKEAALREARALNPRPDAVADAGFAASEFLDPRDLVQVRYEMVRRVRIDGESVSAAAGDFGFSRPSWYAAAAAIDEGGLPGLLRARPGPRRAHKLSEEIVTFLAGVLEGDPGLRAPELARRVEESFGLRVHPRSIERALERSQGPKSR
jgi:transposase